MTPTATAELVRGLASSTIVTGGSVNVSVSASGVGTSVPLPLPKLDALRNVPIRHIVTFPVRRGHRYRLQVILQATAQQEFAPLTGQAQNASIEFFGNDPILGTQGLLWDDARLVLGDDVVEILDLLDESLADHDAALAQHDADIKARLEGIDDDLDEIKRLLITPTGRRPGFPHREDRRSARSGN